MKRDICEGRTIWNSDGTEGPALICPPPTMNKAKNKAGVSGLPAAVTTRPTVLLRQAGDLAMSHVKMICSFCKSEDVSRDATARWNFAGQEWELASVQDQAYCDDCDGETSLEEKEL